MAGKSTGLALKHARREGAELFLKALGCKEKSKKFERKPGQHAARAVRLSNYGVQLREKQKIKRIYGVQERQFRNYYIKASKKKGATGVLLLEFLESRLDNIVYRAGFAATRAEARQLVSHRAVTVDGKVVNIPSFSVKPGSTIAITEKSSNQKRIDYALSLRQERGVSIDWIDTNSDKKLAVFVRMPDRSELPADYYEQLIVELYSK